MKNTVSEEVTFARLQLKSEFIQFKIFRLQLEAFQFLYFEILLRFTVIAHYMDIYYIYLCVSIYTWKY